MRTFLFSEERGGLPYPAWNSIFESTEKETFLTRLVRFCQLSGLFVLPSSCVLGAFSAYGQGDLSGVKRSVTIADAIGMTRLADESYFHGRSSNGSVAQFSPDAKHFVIVTRKGNIERNTNEFSLFLFETAKVFPSPQPDCILTMSSSSNRDAISAIKWLDDNETIVLRGESPGEVAQIYALNIKTRHLEKLTNHPTAITTYDTAPDGSTILYTAGAPKQVGIEEQIRRKEIVIRDQSLQDLLAGDCSEPSWDAAQLFLQQRGRATVHIPMEGLVGGPNYQISLSPD